MCRSGHQVACHRQMDRSECLEWRSGLESHVGDAGLQTETQVKGKAETNQFYTLRTYHAQGPLLCILGGHAGT